MSALVFMDTETTGLALSDDIWEFAAVRRDEGGTETELHMFIDHDLAKCSRLPQSFRDDHESRYRDHQAVTRTQACRKIYSLFGHTGDKPHVVGAVPDFDVRRIEVMCGLVNAAVPRWHYHLIDVENLAVGWLFGQHSADPSTRQFNVPDPVLELPWDSNILSKQVGVDPDQFERHTAMGDVRWAMAIYDAVTGVSS